MSRAVNEALVEDEMLLALADRQITVVQAVPCGCGAVQRS